MTEIHCKISPGEATTLRFNARDVETGDVFEIRRCEGSGAVFTHPQPADLDRYYPADYREFHPLVERLFRVMYARHAARVVKRIGAAGKILEIGCGAGWMLEAFARRGWEAVGFERTAHIARQVSQRTGLRVYSGSLAAIPPEGGFDVVMLYNVLEHISDPDQCIGACRALLKPGGSIVITLPNILSWQARLTGAGWFHLDVPRHLFHFSEASLRMLLQKHGLAVRSLRNTSLALDVFGWVQSLQNLLLPWPNALHRLLSQSNPARLVFSPRGMLVSALTLLLALPALLAAVASRPLLRGAIMEAWTTPEINP